MKKSRNNKSFLQGVITGIAVYFLILFLLLAVSAWLIVNGNISEKNIPYVCTGILIVSTLASSAVAIGRSGEKPALTGGICGAAYLLILLSINALFLNGEYSGVGATALCIMGSVVCSVLVGIRQGKRGKRRTRK